jgi:hypothetical protein
MKPVWNPQRRRLENSKGVEFDVIGFGGTF